MTIQRLRSATLFTFLSAALVAAACNQAPVEDGDDDDGGSSQDDDGGAGAGNPTGGSSSVDFQCCINGVGYACPSNAALTQCIGFDIDACMMACGFDDFACQDSCFDQWDNSVPDPSACSQNAAVDCSSGPTGGGPTGICAGDWDGSYCDTDSNCSSYNCVNDKCYGNAAGNPCDTDSDCTSYNCYQNCCYGNGAGEPCDTDSDCTSYNCYANVCQ